MLWDQKLHFLSTANHTASFLVSANLTIDSFSFTVWMLQSCICVAPPVSWRGGGTQAAVQIGPAFTSGSDGLLGRVDLRCHTDAVTFTIGLQDFTLSCPTRQLMAGAGAIRTILILTLNLLPKDVELDSGSAFNRWF